MFETDHPRKAARRAVQHSVPAQLWERNFTFRRSLQGLVQSHRIMRHDALSKFNSGAYILEGQHLFHLEFRHAFAQIFADAVVSAMVTSSQLEQRLGAIGKSSARFLLQLNLLDQLGFIPNQPSFDGYSGHPYLAHCVQLEDTLQKFGVSASTIDAYEPTPQASACRATFEDTYGDHVELTTILAISESVFMPYATAWAHGTANQITDDSSFHYTTNMTNYDHALNNSHCEDAWHIMQQSITPDRYDEITGKVARWLETWSEFFDLLLHILPDTSRPTF